MKIVKKNQLKIIIFTAVKNFCILHGRVFVMLTILDTIDLLSYCRADKVQICSLLFKPRCEKTGLRGFRPGSTQTKLYNYRRWLEA